VDPAEGVDGSASPSPPVDPASPEARFAGAPVDPPPSDSPYPFQAIMSEVGTTPTIDNLMREKLFKIAASVFHPASTIGDVVAALRAFHQVAYGCTLDDLADLRQNEANEYVDLTNNLAKHDKRRADNAEAECEKPRAKNDKLEREGARATRQGSGVS
jgi:hypothetical protein